MGLVMQAIYDVVIVGGGMVGGTLACALGNTDLKVAVIENSLPDQFDPEQSHDLRVSALSVASENILRNINVWPGLESRRVCPYQRMKVWEVSESHAGTLFDAQEMGYNHLGHIVENRILQLALIDQLQAYDNVDLFLPDHPESIDFSPGSSLLELASGKQLVAKLLVAADGGNSNVRSSANIGVSKTDYDQYALVASVTTAYEQQDITWQQFYPTGPRAFLPLSGNKASLVWYDKPERVKYLATLSNDELLSELLTHFPEELGEIDAVLGRAYFPLKCQHAHAYVKEGVALVGDSAHIINPLAGQGVNIGLLDAAQLAEVILEGYQSGLDISSLDVLNPYEKMRKHHNMLMQQTMHVFYHVFSNNILPLKLIRNIGLGLAQNITPAKRKVMAFAMGLEGGLPELARS